MQLTNPLLVALFVKNGKTCSNPKFVKTDTIRTRFDTSDAILTDCEHHLMDSRKVANVLRWQGLKAQLIPAAAMTKHFCS